MTYRRYVNRVAPKMPFMVQGHAFRDVRWDKGAASISGHKVCTDKSCRGFDGYHIESCKRKTIDKKANIAKDILAILRGWQSTMQINQSQVSAVRKMAEHTYNDKICSSCQLPPEGHPVQERHLLRGPLPRLG